MLKTCGEEEVLPKACSLKEAPVTAWSSAPLSSRSRPDTWQGFRKWKSHVTERPFEDRSEAVKELYSELNVIKPSTGTLPVIVNRRLLKALAEF
jgi:hypothetical protein